MTGLVAVLVLAASAPAGIAVSSGALVGALGEGGAATAATSLIGAVAAVLGVLLLLQQIMPPIAQAIAEVLGRRLNRDVSDRMLAILHRPPGLEHLEHPTTARLLSQVHGDFGASTARDGVVGLVNVSIARAGAVGGAIVLSFYRWWLGPLVLAALLVAMMLISRSYQRALASAEGTPDRIRRAMYLKELASTAPAAKEVRVFGLSSWLLDAYRREIWTALGEVRSGRAGSGVASLGSGAIATAVFALTFVLLAVDVGSGRLTTAQFTTFTLATTLLLGLANVSPDLSNIAAAGRMLRAAGELERWIGDQPAGADHPGSVEPPRRTIRFEGVGFRYPGASGWILRGVDLEIPIGRSTAIVGINGAGKTTLVKLLCGLYEPTEGRITIDDVDLRELDRAAWQRQFAALFQDWIRWGLTVRENVTFGGEGENRSDELERVARWSGLADVLEELPDGWSTVLRREFGGVDLSGGQWQRVGLARALWASSHGASVLVLDEPTAALDVRGEAELYDLLLEAVEEKTVVLISHRFSTVRHAEQILVLADGAVIERGNHETLLAQGGQYAQMFTVQAEYFGEDRG